MGEKRRLQLLLVLLSEPNLIVLDEPSNDVDTDMLAAMEDLFNSWPGTLIVVSHDRYLVERITRISSTRFSTAGCVIFREGWTSICDCVRCSPARRPLPWLLPCPTHRSRCYRVRRNAPCARNSALLSASWNGWVSGS